MRHKIGSALVLGGVVLALAGCGSGGIVFNGVGQAEQYPIRKVPITHYNLPSEMFDPQSLEPSLDETTMISVTAGTFIQRPIGHDMWGMDMLGGVLTDNPGVPQGIPDWVWQVSILHPVSGAWKDFKVAPYTLSFQNQWFLRDVTGAPFVSAVPGEAPITYENLGYSSMPISIYDWATVGGLAVQPSWNLAINAFTSPVQQEIEPDPNFNTFDSRNIPRVHLPVTNFVYWGYNGAGAPEGLLAMGWQEKPALNEMIEANFGVMNGPPVPEYFGGGGTVSGGGGVYCGDYGESWEQTTNGNSSLVSYNDTMTYSYFMAAIGNHVIGYGLGLIDSSFAIPGVINSEENIMNLSVIFDLSAFIAAGKHFQFVPEDLIRMQDIIDGDFLNPGPDSTLPGYKR